jgi:hypothetical protein
MCYYCGFNSYLPAASIGTGAGSQFGKRDLAAKNTHSELFLFRHNRTGKIKGYISWVPQIYSVEFDSGLFAETPKRFFSGR